MVHTDDTVHALRVFEPAPSSFYTIDAAAHLAGLPRHLVLVYYKHGLISPYRDPDFGGYYFDAPAIRRLQRIGYLHRECGINLTGVQMILNLADEVLRLRTERGWS